MPCEQQHRLVWFVVLAVYGPVKLDRDL